jgi:hypothetical protein
MRSIPRKVDQLFFEIGFTQLNKFGEELCGDSIVVDETDNSSTIILSDGLGSGVKANILSTLTSKIISVMMKDNCAIDDVVDTLIETLPTCKTCQLAYSTFSLMKLDTSGFAQLTEYDNPATIFLRDNKIQNIDYNIRNIKSKKIKKAELEIKDGDILVFISDGEVHPGIDGKCNLRWSWEKIADFVKRISSKSMSAMEIAFELTNVANQLYGQKPGDDTSAVVVRVRHRRFAHVMIGAPIDKSQDQTMVHDFMQTSAHKIICGGTTGNIVSRELGKPITVDISTIKNDIPPIGILEGINLCTEGIITLSNALKLLQSNVSYKKLEMENNGASRLVQELLRADNITFFVGYAKNPANQPQNIPPEFDLKNQITDKLRKELRVLGKRIEIKTY